MANEISVSASIEVNNGNFRISFSSGAVRVDQTTATGGNPGVVEIGTSEETVSFGDVTPGLVWMRNLDATNFVTWGNTTGNLAQKLAPGGVPTLVEINSGSLIMQADTAACNVQIIGVSP